MLGYLQELKDELTGLKTGVSGHATEWTGQAETPTTIQANITALDTMDGQITDLKNQLFLKRKAARLLQKSTQLVCDTIVAKAIGFHKAHPDELDSYGIKVPKPKEKKPVPSAVLVPVIKDEEDGIGFMVSTQFDPDADVYEWERGIASDPTDMVTIPKMVLYKQTLKTNFIDEDVSKGVRYFYRVRATNANGEGPWSTVQSRVQ